MVEEQSGTTRHHLVIAGTGRAGTSFLVRYLHQLGLETELAGAHRRPSWDAMANAGLETNFLVETNFNTKHLHAYWSQIPLDETIRNLAA